MAKRRVNVQFLWIAGAVILGVPFALVAVHYLHRGDPHKYLDVARRLWHEGNLVDAAANFDKAVSLNPKDLAVRNEFGVLLHDLTRQDPAFGGKDRELWNSVLSADPMNKEALHHMMDLEVEIVQFLPDPQSFARLHDVAEKILRTNSGDVEANAYLHISVIAGWLANIVTPDAMINDNANALARLARENPSNPATAAWWPDVPYYLATAYVRQAREARTRSDTNEAIKLEKKADAVFADAVQAQPKNAVIRLRAYQVYRMLADAQDDNDDAKDRDDYVKLSREMLVKAKEDIQPDDPAFAEIHIAYAEFLRRNKDSTGAEKVLRELREKKPDDQLAKRQLAQLLHADPKKRDEAIALLKTENKDSGERGITMYRNKFMQQTLTYLELTNYLIESFGGTSDQNKRAALGKEIDEYYQKLVDRMGVQVETLKLKGKIAMMKNGNKGAIEAIPDLEKARELFRVKNGATRKDWELEYLLASAYFESMQTGPAKEQLKTIVEGMPSFVPARILYARLLLTDHEADAAKEQIRVLKEQVPNDPEVARLEMAYYILDPQKLSAQQIEDGLAKMPETTRMEMLRKIPLYLAAKKVDDAVRLFEALRKETPADIDVVRSLVQIYMSKDKKPQAIQVADEAIAKDPSNLALQIVRAQIDKDQKKVAELTRKAIEGITDPFRREKTLYDFCAAQGENAEALRHLDAAEKINPEDADLMDLRFGMALRDGKWDDAEKYAARLGIKDRDEAHGLIYRFRVAMAKGDIKAAEDCARELVRTRPQFGRSWLCYGDVLRAQGHIEDALAKFQMAKARQNGNIEAYQGIIDCYYALKRPDDAHHEIQAGLKINPGNSYLQEQEIGWQLNYGDAKTAIAPRKKSAEANPEALGAQLAYGAALWQVAQQRVQKNSPEEAKEYIGKARDVFGAIIAKWPDDRLAYAYLADIATFQNDLPAGEKALKDLAAREKWKDSPEPILLLADYYVRFAKFDEAEATYHDAVTKSKNALEVQRRFASFYSAQRKFDKALGVLDRNSTDRNTQQQILEAMLADNKLTDAQQYLNKLLAARPDDVQFLATQGFLLFQEKKLPEALAVLDKSLALEPRNPTALFYRGMIKLRHGPSASDEAIKDLTAARNLLQDDRFGTTPRARLQVRIQTRMALAEALRSHSPPQIDEAVVELQSCLRLEPTNKDIRMRLVEMLGSVLPPRWVEAEQVITEAKRLKEFENDPDWWSVESSMYLTRELPDKALASIRKALQLAQGQPQRILPLMQNYLNVLMKLKKYRELVNECNQQLKNEQIAKDGWWVYQMRGVGNANLDGKRADALADFDKALNIAGLQQNTDAAVAIIQTISDSIGADEAIARCEREAEKAENHNHWRVILTYLYFSKQDYAKAESTIEKVLGETDKLTPKEKETALGVAGSVYMLAGDYKKAQDTFEKLLAISPDDPVSLNNLACVWVDCLEPPDPAKALTYSTRAMEIVQKTGELDANTMDTHGWVLTCNNHVDDGLTFLQASAERSALDRRSILEVHYHLGAALLKKNRAPEALHELEKARKLMDERQNKRQPTDAKLEARLNEALVKAKQMVNDISAQTNQQSKP